MQLVSPPLSSLPPLPSSSSSALKCVALLYSLPLLLSPLVGSCLICVKLKSLTSPMARCISVNIEPWMLG